MGRQELVQDDLPRPSTESDEATTSMAKEHSHCRKLFVGADDFAVRPSSEPGRKNHTDGLPGEHWHEDLKDLQRQYLDMLRSTDSRAAQRTSLLRSQLEESRSSDMPPSYPPSECSDKVSSVADAVETDLEPEEFDS